MIVDARAKNETKRRIRQLCFDRQNGLCYYCKTPMEPPTYSTAATAEVPPPNGATLEHLTPRSQGGLTVESNCVAACLSCNQKRGDVTFEKFFEKI